MSSSDFTQRRRQEHQVQAAAVAEEEQHGSHGHGKDECAEAADQMLDRLLDEMNTPGRGQGEKSGTRPPDSTRRSSMEREVGEGVKALTGAGEKEAQKRVVAVQAGVGERKKAQKPAAVEEVTRPVSLPPEQPPGLEVVQGKGKGGLLSAGVPFQGYRWGMCQHLPDCLKQPATHKLWRTVLKNRAGGVNISGTLLNLT